MGRIAGRFGRVEPRRRARAFVLGLLSGLPRKNCWSIAEYAGDQTPGGMQHLLGRARWDADAVRDDLRGYLTERLGDPGAVLVVDETGDVKKGTATAGVQRQYTGTAGRTENAQVAVYLAYVAPAGHALIDRELYLPRSWITDPGRCQAAGIPEQTAFATKPALARRMLARTLDASVPAAWVAGDEVYGADPGLRSDLEKRETGYVLAVACRHTFSTGLRTYPRRRTRPPPAPASMAAVLRRRRRQGPPLLRLGLGVHRPRPARAPVAAHPPQPAHPRTGLLPVLLTPARPAGHPGQGRRAQMDQSRRTSRPARA